jgi:hypothetical protein
MKVYNLQLVFFNWLNVFIIKIKIQLRSTSQTLTGKEFQQNCITKKFSK